MTQKLSKKWITGGAVLAASIVLSGCSATTSSSYGEKSSEKKTELRTIKYVVNSNGPTNIKYGDSKDSEMLTTEGGPWEVEVTQEKNKALNNYSSVSLNADLKIPLTVTPGEISCTIFIDGKQEVHQESSALAWCQEPFVK